MAVDPGVSPAGRDAALKTLKSIAGMDRSEATGAGAGERFSVTINLGDSPSDGKLIVDAPVVNAGGEEDGL